MSPSFGKNDQDTGKDASDRPALNGKTAVPDLKDVIEGSTCKFLRPRGDDIPDPGADDATGKATKKIVRKKDQSNPFLWAR